MSISTSFNIYLALLQRRYTQIQIITYYQAIERQNHSVRGCEHVKYLKFRQKISDQYHHIIN